MEGAIFHLFGSYLDRPDEANDIDLIYTGPVIEDELATEADMLGNMTLPFDLPTTAAVEDLGEAAGRSVDIFFGWPDEGWIGKTIFWPHDELARRCIVPGTDKATDSYGVPMPWKRTTKGVWFLSSVFIGSSFAAESAIAVSLESLRAAATHRFDGRA